MGIALSAIAIGTVVMVGYYLVSKIGSSIPTPTYANGTTDTVAQTGIDNAKNTVFSGFSLITVGVIVLAAFGIIAIFS